MPDAVGGGGIRVVLTDIDDTLSTAGTNSPARPTWRSRSASRGQDAVIPITRPSRRLVRPHRADVARSIAVVGEKRARFYMWHDDAGKKLHRRFIAG
jgi:hypothetical protein